MNYPKKSIWFDSVWPEDSKGEGHFVLVPVHRHTNIGEVAEKAKQSPQTIYMLLFEDFIVDEEHVAKRFPDEWNRMPPDGIPWNIWIGTSIITQEEADRRLPLLMKMRARKLFVVAKRERGKLDILTPLLAWRCSFCGRKGRIPRPLRCPTGTLCAGAGMEGSRIDPQIHWVIDMDPSKGGIVDEAVRGCGVALWNGEFLEVPE